MLTFDATSSAYITGSSGSWNHTISNNSNRILIITFSMYGAYWADLPTTCKFNGVDCIFIGYANGTPNAMTFMYSYINPPVGTYAVSFNTPGGTNTLSCISVSYYGLDDGKSYSFPYFGTCLYSDHCYTSHITNKTTQLCITAAGYEGSSATTIDGNSTLIKKEHLTTLISTPGEADGFTTNDVMIVGHGYASSIGIVLQKTPTIIGNTQTFYDYANVNIKDLNTTLIKISTTGSSFIINSGYSYSKVASGSGNVKLVVWDSSGNVFGVSDAAVATGSDTWVYYTFSNGLTLNANSIYYCGLITDNSTGGIRTYRQYVYTYGGTTTFSGSYSSPGTITPANINYLPDTFGYMPAIYLSGGTTTVASGTVVSLGALAYDTFYSHPTNMCSVITALSDGIVVNAQVYTMRDRNYSGDDTRVMICDMDGYPIENGVSDIRSGSGDTSYVWYTATYTFPAAPLLVANTLYKLVAMGRYSGSRFTYSVGTGGFGTLSGSFVDPVKYNTTDYYHERKAGIKLNYIQTSPLKTYTVEVAGSGLTTGLFRRLAEGMNHEHNVLTYFTVPKIMQVTYLAFYGRASQNEGSQAWIVIGTLSGNAITPVIDGTFGYANSSITSPYWVYCYYANKPVLYPGVEYVIGLQNRGIYAWNIGYTVATDPRYTHYAGSTWAIDEPNRSYSMYVVGNSETPTGPLLKIEGETPGKLEYTSWSDISDVR